jgi:hypothetical protein
MTPFVIAAFAIFIGIVFWLLMKRRRRSGLSSLNRRKSGPPLKVAEAPKPVPDFLNEMRRKDQSMTVETQKTEKAEFDLQEICRKEKEITAELRSSKMRANCGIGLFRADK